MLMKNLVTGLLSLFIVFSFSSCEKTQVIENYYPMPNKTFIYTVSSNAWTGAGNRISHQINLPELTNYYLLQGGVAVAVSFDDENSYDLLPATIDGVSYSVNYGVGKVVLFAEDPIMESGITINPPSSIQVKIILSESDYVE